jgi:Mg-chelatase subunit ChlD
VILLIDVSPSTAFKIDEIHDAAISFVDQLRAEDKVMVIAFDERVRVLSQVTNNRTALRNAIRRAEFGDGTSLYEAVDHVINRDCRESKDAKPWFYLPTALTRLRGGQIIKAPSHRRRNRSSVLPDSL